MTGWFLEDYYESYFGLQTTVIEQQCKFSSKNSKKISSQKYLSKKNVKFYPSTEVELSFLKL